VASGFSCCGPFEVKSPLFLPSVAPLQQTLQNIDRTKISMFEIIVTVDKHQRFKSFIRQTRSIRLEHCPATLKIRLLLISKLLTTYSYCRLRSSARQHGIVQLLIENETNSDANTAGHLSIGPIVNG